MTARLLPGYGVVVETGSGGRLLPGYGVLIETISGGGGTTDMTLLAVSALIAIRKRHMSFSVPRTLPVVARRVRQVAQKIAGVLPVVALRKRIVGRIRRVALAVAARRARVVYKLRRGIVALIATLLDDIEDILAITMTAGVQAVARRRRQIAQKITGVVPVLARRVREVRVRLTAILPMLRSLAVATLLAITLLAGVSVTPDIFRRFFKIVRKTVPVLALRRRAFSFRILTSLYVRITFTINTLLGSLAPAEYFVLKARSTSWTAIKRVTTWIVNDRGTP